MCEVSLLFASRAVTGRGVPPAGETCTSPPVENVMMSSAPHSGPRLRRRRRWSRAFRRSTRLSSACRPPIKPTHCPSGEKNGAGAPSAPGTARASADRACADRTAPVAERRHRRGGGRQESAATGGCGATRAAHLAPAQPSDARACRCRDWTRDAPRGKAGGGPPRISPIAAQPSRSPVRAPDEAAVGQTRRRRFGNPFQFPFQIARRLPSLIRVFRETRPDHAIERRRRRRRCSESAAACP